ncbi:MAG: hypothetical protein JXA67_18525 [Micromonosporaceae bacterium]|nr:hypothetical protein [Micromonosporaceae bacterium]
MKIIGNQHGYIQQADTIHNYGNVQSPGGAAIVQMRALLDQVAGAREAGVLDASTVGSMAADVRAAIAEARTDAQGAAAATSRMRRVRDNLDTIAAAAPLVESATAIIALLTAVQGSI